MMDVSDAALRSRTPRVLCYGDSLTAGFTAMTKYTGAFCPWAPHLADALGVAVDHAGSCGWTTAQMLDGLDSEANVDVCEVSNRGLRRLLEEGHYTHVLLMSGTNDLKAATSTEIAERLDKLHAVCHAAGARTLALAIPHSKKCAVSESRGERRRKANQKLRKLAAASSGWSEYSDPGEVELEWEEGSPYFEQDGLHLTRSGYAEFASLLLGSGTLHAFLRRHQAFVPILPQISDGEIRWRRGMRHWMQQYRDAIDTVQDHVFDAQMAKTSAEELEQLHKVLQAEGIPGLRAVMKALELKALHRVLMDEGLGGLRLAVKASKRAKMAAARARSRGVATFADVAKLAQTAFVPAVRDTMTKTTQRLGGAARDSLLSDWMGCGYRVRI